MSVFSQSGRESTPKWFLLQYYSLAFPNYSDFKFEKVTQFESLGCHCSYRRNFLILMAAELQLSAR